MAAGSPPLRCRLQTHSDAAMQCLTTSPWWVCDAMLAGGCRPALRGRPWRRRGQWLPGGLPPPGSRAACRGCPAGAEAAARCGVPAGCRGLVPRCGVR